MTEEEREIERGALAFLEVGLRRIKRGWIQVNPATDRNGFPCAPWNDEARKWCLTGSFFTYNWHEPWYDRITLKHIERAKKHISDALDLGYDATGWLVRWNDSPERKQEDVISAMTLAIERCKRRLNDDSNN